MVDINSNNLKHLSTRLTSQSLKECTHGPKQLNTSH